MKKKKRPSEKKAHFQINVLWLLYLFGISLGNNISAQGFLFRLIIKMDMS